MTSNRRNLYIGLMSGTSMDGIDAALVEFTGSQTPKLIETHAVPFDTDVRERLRALASGEGSIDELGSLDHLLGKLFASAALRLMQHADVGADRIHAIGSHGQTIRHRPNLATPFTLQIGDPNLIAQITGITTVADLRRRDMAAGGEGAPLAPAFHQAWFSDPGETRVIVNIGGIANITVLPADHATSPWGFDTGPGNTLLDAWIRKHQGKSFDEDGRWASAGTCHSVLLRELLSDPYFSKPHPKSTGPEYFNLAWLEAPSGNFDLAPRDMQATLASLTATSIGDAIRQTAPSAGRLLICGGGAHNTALMELLVRELPEMRIGTTADTGIDPDWVEAIGFAWLAYRTLNGSPGNLPQVTGAREPVVLGGIYPGAGRKVL